MEGEYPKKVEKPWSFEICLPLHLNMLAMLEADAKEY